MRVLITRPTGAAQAAAHMLQAAGHDVLVCPLVAFAKTQVPAPSLAATQGFIVTDADGARALADLVGVRTFPVFCDSAGTAAELADLGFQDARSADGDAAALARLIERTLSPKLGGLIYVCSSSAPINLSAMLGNMGFAVRMVAPYEVQRAERLPEALSQALTSHTLDAAVFFTADEARAFAQLVVRAQLEHHIRHVIAVVAAPVVAAPLSVLKFARVVTASRSDAASVCHIVSDALLPQPEPASVPAAIPDPPVVSTPDPIAEPHVTAPSAPAEEATPEPAAIPPAVIAEPVAEPTQDPEVARAEPSIAETIAPLVSDVARPTWRQRVSAWMSKPAPTQDAVPPVPMAEATPDVPEKQAEVPISEPQPHEDSPAPAIEVPAPITEPVPVEREEAAVALADIATPTVVTPESTESPEPQDTLELAAPEPTRPSWSDRLRKRFAKPTRLTDEMAADTRDGAMAPTIVEDTARPNKEPVVPEPIEVSAPEAATSTATAVAPSVARALLERTSAWVRQRTEARKTEGEDAVAAPVVAAEPEPVPVVVVDVAPIETGAIGEATPSPEPVAPREVEPGLLEATPVDPKPVSDEGFAAARAGWLDWAKSYFATKTTATEATSAAESSAPSAVEASPAVDEKTPPRESALATLVPAPEEPARVPIPDPPPEPPAASEPLIVPPPTVKTPETPTNTIAADMSEPDAPNTNDPDAPRTQRTGGRAARLWAEDAADARALNQRFKVAGTDGNEEDADQASATTTPMPPPPRRGLPGIVYVMLLLIIAGGAAYVYGPDLMKRAPEPVVATAPQPASPTPQPEASVVKSPDVPAPATQPPPTVSAPEPAAAVTQDPAPEPRVTPTPAEIAALEQRLVALETAVKASAPAELGDSVTNQARQLTTVTARLATLEAAIGNVAKLEDIAARLNALEGKSAAAASVLALSERVSSLERRDAVAATALVVASAQLRDAVRAGRPYAVELETVKQLAQRASVAFNADVLTGAARTGLATKDQLLSSYVPMAAAANRAGMLPTDTADWFQRLSDRVMSIVSIRPFGQTEGTSAGAILARAEQALRANNVALAITEVETLSGAAAEAAASWLASARSQVAIELSLEDLATRSVGAMGATTATSPAPAP